MSRQLTPRSTLESLKKEAKRWLKALSADDADARARLDRAHPHASAEPSLRDVQHALAREHGFPGWAALKDAVTDIEKRGSSDLHPDTIRELLEAAAIGDSARVVQLLDSHPNIVNERAIIPGHSGMRTALHHAIRYELVVSALLERGADPNIRDEGDAAMPLHFAAENGNLSIIRMLLEHGADPIGSGDYHELEVIGWAAVFGKGRRDVVDYLITHGARHNIFSAVAMGEVAILRGLAASAPADLDRPMDRTNVRRRPLHLAVVSKRPESLSALLDLGADTEAADEAGLTPLDQAALNREAEMVQLLIDAGAEVRLPTAIALERTDDIERLLRQDPECLKPGNRWGGLIVRASEHARGHVIETLIRLGASVQALDNAETSVDSTSRYTPLHAAAYHGNADAVAVLLKHRADVMVRDSKYCGTPAGWADHAGHRAVRDQILAARIDPFQAIDYDLTDRIPGIVQEMPWLLDRPFREYVTCEPRPDQWWPEPWHTPLTWAVIKNRAKAVRVLLEQGAAQKPALDGRTLQQIAADAGREDIVRLLQQHRRVDQTHESRVRWFVKNACPDHRIRGGTAHVIARHTAERLLKRFPEIAQDSFYTAIVCGDVHEVERLLAQQPELAKQKGGPKGWEPLLYLCFTRLPSGAAASDNALAIARLLLDHGADPNAYFMAGDSRYTPLVGAIGEGEEDRPAHPQRDALVQLLLERGAEPYDIQVLYNIHFHGNVLWFLELIYYHAMKQGRQADWRDPNWPMLDMGGYGCGARYLLDIAVKRNDSALAEWLLVHGASANAPPPADPRFPKRSLHESAVRAGFTELADLLVRYGATRGQVVLDDKERFVAACLRLDRDQTQALLEQHPEFLHSPRALETAAKQDRADVVAYLLDLGMSIEIENRERQRPLHHAAYSNALRVAELLIARGAEIDPVETSWNNTPLDFAVYAQHPRMIELLSRYSRDIWNLTFTGNVERLREVLDSESALAKVVSKSNATPLMWLPDDEDRAQAIIKLFLEHGADLAVRNTEGMTAADYARRRGMYQAAELLE